MKRLLILTLAIVSFPLLALGEPHVVVAVIDGLRYTEGFGGGNTYIPYMWDNMRSSGTIYTNFYNYGQTATCPGHAAICTGTWQNIANDGSERPSMPTMFEYFRKQTATSQANNYVVAGKSKLAILTYSTHTDYGSSYQATDQASDQSDPDTYSNLISVMDTYRPQLIVANFKDVDTGGHSVVWEDYTRAIGIADSLVYELWQHIQGDTVYSGNTTLFITNDHGRHDDTHGGFSGHGDSCGGCQHIMLLAIGRGVASQDIAETHDMRDIAPTIGDILGFTTPLADGTSLYEGDFPLPVSLASFTAIANNGLVTLRWITESEVDNLGFNLYRSLSEDRDYVQINSTLIPGTGNSAYRNEYEYVDKGLSNGVSYWYKLEDVDYDGKVTMHGPIQVTPEASPLIGEYRLYQNYPNPFNPKTVIRYDIKETGRAVLKIFNLSGQEVTTLVDEFQERGIHQENFDASRLGAGIYFYRLKVNGFVGTKKLVVLK